MQEFSDALLQMESVDHVKALALFDRGKEVSTIENKLGKSGSVKVYYHLYKRFGRISVAAAKEGLSLFSEHTADAKENPGNHPNIDRLFQVIDDAKELTVKVITV